MFDKLKKQLHEEKKLGLDATGWNPYHQGICMICKKDTILAGVLCSECSS